MPHIHTYHQFKIAISPIRPWEGAEVPREKPYTQGQNTKATPNSSVVGYIFWYLFINICQSVTMDFYWNIFHGRHIIGLSCYSTLVCICRLWVLSWQRSCWRLSSAQRFCDPGRNLMFAWTEIKHTNMHTKAHWWCITTPRWPCHFWDDKSPASLWVRWPCLCNRSTSDNLPTNDNNTDVFV